MCWLYCVRRPSSRCSFLIVAIALLSSVSPLLFVFFLIDTKCVVSKAVEEFLGEVRSREQPQSAGLVSHSTAVKFLMARKFDVSRAICLFQAYKVMLFDL